MEKHIFNLEVMVNDKQKQIDAAIEASKDNQKNLAEENLIRK